MHKLTWQHTTIKRKRFSASGTLRCNIKRWRWRIVNVTNCWTTIWRNRRMHCDAPHLNSVARHATNALSSIAEWWPNIIKFQCIRNVHVTIVGDERCLRHHRRVWDMPPQAVGGWMKREHIISVILHKHVPEHCMQSAKRKRNTS